MTDQATQGQAAGGQQGAGTGDDAGAASAGAGASQQQQQTQAQQQAGQQQGGQQQQQQQSGGVPEKYELKLPDGALIDPKAIERTAAQAKALGLSQEGAQKALDFANGEVKAYHEGLTAQHQERVKGWTEALKTDTEIGGANLEANGQLAWRVIQKFAADTTLEADLKSSGYNHHPGLFKLLARIGKAMGEDQLVTGAQGGAAPKGAADVLYGGGAQK